LEPGRRQINMVISNINISYLCNNKTSTRNINEKYIFEWFAFVNDFNFQVGTRVGITVSNPPETLNVVIIKEANSGMTVFCKFVTILGCYVCLLCNCVTWFMRIFVYLQLSLWIKFNSTPYSMYHSMVGSIILYGCIWQVIFITPLLNYTCVTFR
jgi:hypothetical protein